MTKIGNQINLIHEMMARSQERQQVISSNIANVNTPQYRARDIQFNRVLNDIIEGTETSTHSKSTIAAGSVYEVAGLKVREDGNNVDIDHELGQLDKNVLMFKTYSEILGAKLSLLRTAITGR